MKHNAKMNLIPSVIKVVESLVTLSHLETVLIQYFHSLGFALILMLMVLVFVLKITVLDLILTQVIPYLDIMIQYYISNTNTIKKVQQSKKHWLIIIIIIIIKQENNEWHIVKD